MYLTIIGQCSNFSLGTGMLCATLWPGGRVWKFDVCITKPKHHYMEQSKSMCKHSTRDLDLNWKIESQSLLAASLWNSIVKNIKIYNHFPCVVETGETIHLSHIQGVAGVVTGLGILLCAISAVVNPTIHKYITLYAAVFLCGLPGSAVLIGSFLLHQRLRSQVYKDDFKLYVSISSHKFFF